MDMVFVNMVVENYQKIKRKENAQKRAVKNKIKNIKETILVILLLIMLLLAGGIAGKIETTDIRYGVINGTEIETEDGNIWDLDNQTEISNGSFVKVVFNNKGNDNIKDDEIVSIKETHQNKMHLTSEMQILYNADNLLK